MVKWGIIGTGRIAQTFADDLTLVSGAKLEAVGSRAMETARRFAETNPGINTYGSYEELVHDSNVNAIYVATPHSLHAKNTIDGLRAGKAVLCEKPFTLNLSQARDVVAAARESGTLLVEGMWTYFQPAFQELLKIIASKKYGRILSLNAELGFQAKFNPESRLFDSKLGGGALLDMGIYNVALSTALLGRPEKIEAEADNHETGVDVATRMRFTYADGSVATLACSIAQPTSRQATLVMEKAIIRIPDPWWHCSQIEIQTEDGAIEIIRPDRSGYGFKPMIEEFQRCFAAGLRESPIIPWERTLMNMEIMDQVRELIK